MDRKLLMKREGCLPVINREIAIQRINRATVPARGDDDAGADCGTVPDGNQDFPGTFGEFENREK